MFNPNPPKNMDPNRKLSREELKQQLEIVKKQQIDLQKQLEEIYEKTGWSPQRMIDFLSNPNNFTPAQWEELQKHKKHLDDFIWNQLGAEKKKQAEEKEKEKIQSSRKGKTLGARKKNWIPMK